MFPKSAFSLDGKFLTEKKSKIAKLLRLMASSDSRNFLTIFYPTFSYIAQKHLSGNICGGGLSIFIFQ